MNDPAITESYTYCNTLSLHDALPILRAAQLIGARYQLRETRRRVKLKNGKRRPVQSDIEPLRSEEHTSELQSLMRISYAVFCLEQKRDLENVTLATATLYFSDITVQQTLKNNIISTFICATCT